MPYSPAQSVLSEIDVSNPKALRLVRTLTLDGGYVDARLVGSTARIVVSSQVPTKLPFEQPTESTNAALATARNHNRAVVRVLAPRLVAPDLHDQARRPAGAGRAAARPMPERRPPAAVLRARDADGAHRRPGEGPRPGRLDRRDDRRADRLRLAGQPLPRDRALGRRGRCPATPTEPQPSATSPPRSTASTSPTRRARATAAAARCRATC